MAKDRSLTGIDARKSGKKRKDPPTAAAAASAASGSGSRLQLDDILAGLPTKAVKSTAEVQGKEGRKKLKTSGSGETRLKTADSGDKAKAVKSSVKAKGKTVSALDLLTGPSTTSRSSTPSQPAPTTLNTTSIKLKKPPKSIAADSTPPTASPPSTAVAPIPTLKRATSPSPLPSAARSHADTLLDVPSLLKTYKTSYRHILSALSALEEEGRLLKRVWYKNASQFKSALWWAALNSVRRTLRSLLVHSALHSLTLVYAALGGGEDAVAAQQARLDSLPQDGTGWAGLSLPKLTARPTSVEVRTWLSSKSARELLDEAVDKVEAVGRGVRVVKERCASAGKVLVRHLNTPPAPTFAPLVSALLALVANVDAQTRALVAQPDEKAAKEEDGDAEVGPVNALHRLLLDLRQA